MFGVAKATMAKDDNTFSPWAWRAFDSGLNSGCHASMAIDNEGNVYGMIYTSDLTTTIYSVASDGSVRWTTPIENTGKQDQGGVVIGTDGTVIEKSGRYAWRNCCIVSRWNYQMAI